jgi:hypothetical protein
LSEPGWVSELRVVDRQITRLADEEEARKSTNRIHRREQIGRQNDVGVHEAANARRRDLVDAPKCRVKGRSPEFAPIDPANVHGRELTCRLSDPRIVADQDDRDRER